MFIEILGAAAGDKPSTDNTTEKLTNAKIFVKVSTVIEETTVT